MLGEDGKKMSKRLKNYTETGEIFDTLGADALRWYLLSGQAPWNSIRFSKAAIQESQREFLIRLQNVYSFFVIYANLDQFDPRSVERPVVADRALLDRWIISELQQLMVDVTERLDAFENTTAAIAIDAFVDALSNWYVRRSRDRFWGSGLSADKRAAHWTLYECLTTLCRVLAPFTPFLAEGMYQNLVRGVDAGAVESVHLCDWPVADRSLIDPVLASEMGLVREIVSVGRSARTASKIKVRQPLSRVEVLLADHRHDPVVLAYHDLMADELNVKTVEVAANPDDYVAFTIKPDLKKLGPKLGKRLPAVKSALASADAQQVRASLVATGSFDLAIGDETIVLTSDDVLVEIAAKPGYAAAEGKRAVVVLATQITDELKREGLARELVHHIQGMRRTLDLAFDDRIELGIVSASDMVDVVQAHHQYIAQETLAVHIGGSALVGASVKETVDVDGSAVTVTLRRVDSVA
jgi:isoleucyl-tRNA synthetase